MSNEILALKYRPKFFREVVGQDKVVKTIQNSIKLDKVHNAYLFSGTRGMGKTTIARLFAKSLLCNEGIHEEPCGKCSSCQEIDNTNHIDLIEIDAASRTKVEDTRNLMENVLYAPSKSRFKVYLIDEVHMLSTKSFNALLKTIEEPPNHVKFLLATTESEKLPDTILSRCLHFRLDSASHTLITDHLKKVLQKENITHDGDSLNIIAKNSFGSIRDSLSILERCISFCKEDISRDKVASLLGDVDTNVINEIYLYLESKSRKQLVELIDKLDESTDFLLIIDQLIKKYFDETINEVSNKKENINRTSIEDIQLAYQILVSSKKDYPYAPCKKDYLIMILLRIVIFASESEKNVNVDRNIKIDNDSINNTDALVDHDASLSEIDWINMIKDLKLTGLLEHLANHSVLVNNPDGVTHTLKINQLKKDVYPQTCIDDLTSKIMNHLSLTSKINIIYEDKLDTPMNINQKNNEIDINDRYDKVKDDPDVKKIKRIFNAEVEKGSIKKIIE
tara:strand:- start:278 stop:1798 length:1521 start_codon:yes stop_codon:yes gene_type:complete